MDLPVTPRKGHTQPGLSAARPQGDPLRPTPAQLPPFSSFPPYTPTPPPPVIPASKAYPFRVPTPPSSIYTLSPMSTRFPISPISPTSYFSSPRPVLPPIVSPSKDDWRTRNHSGKTSAPKLPKSLWPGSPTDGRVEKRREIGNNAFKNGVGDMWGKMPPKIRPDTVQCGWLGCTWVEKPLGKDSWTKHLRAHCQTAEPLKTVDGDIVACMWIDGKKKCSFRACGFKGLVLHYRVHNPWAFIGCMTCGQRVTTEDALKKHITANHPG